jgi:hypothetical protein
MLNITGEKTIVAYFPASKEARLAADSIQGSGLGTAKVDLISNVSLSGDPYYENPIILTGVQPTEYARSSGELIQAGNVFNKSGSPQRNNSDRDERFMLTVSTSNNKQEQASEIIRKHGGLV